MGSPKYIFTASNGHLVVKLNNPTSEFDGDQTKTYKSPTLDLFKKSIKLFDFGLFINVFTIDNIETINGAVPTNIQNAFDLLLALFPSSGGGSGGAGDASASNQVLEIAKLTSIDNKTPSLVGGKIPIDGSGVTQPISATSLPLPTGSSTSSLQTIGNTSLSNLESKIEKISNDKLVSGNLTSLGSSVIINAISTGEIGMNIQGTWTGTIKVEGTIDGSVFSALPTLLAGGGNAWTISPVSTNGNYKIIGSSGYTSIKVSFSAYTSGTANIQLDGALGNTTMGIVSLNPANVLTTSNIKDSAGNVITSTSSALDVNIKSSTNLPLPTGASTESTLSNLNSKVTTVNTNAVTISAPLPSGNNLIGKTGIDQTVDGVTNKIALGQIVFQYSANETGNSTIVQLTAGAIFTGVIEAIPNQPAFSVLLFSDQNALLTIRQFIDVLGTQKVYEKIYTYTANSQFAVSAPANGNYFQAILQNTGGSTTTKLNLNTAYGVIDSATQLNNKPHSLNEINGTVISTGQGASDAGTQRHALVNEQVQDLYFTGQSAQTAIIQNIIPTTSSANATDVTGFSSGSIQIVSTGTAGTFIFEGANDSPTNANFQTIPVWNASIQTGSPITSAITASASAILYIFPINFRYLRVRIVTAITGGSIQAFTTIKRANFTGSILQIAQATASNLNTTIGGGTLPTVTTVGTVSTITNTGQLTPGVSATNLGKAEDAVAASGDTGIAVLGLRNDSLTSNVSASGDYIVPVTDIYGAFVFKDQQRHKRTYRASTIIASAASATDLFQLIGSASTTVEVTNIWISGTQTTGGMIDVFIKKRSTANTGGTSTAPALVSMSSSDASATAVASAYTANPTTGIDVGNVWSQTVPLSAVAGTTNNIINIKFGDNAKPLILIGIAQAMAININGVTVAGGSFKITVEFTEY